MFRKKALLIITCFIFFVIVVFLYLDSKYEIAILKYHSISRDQSLGGLAVSPTAFSSQMSFLKRRGYKVISLEELVNNIQKKRKPFYNSVVITFDDGHEDNFREAYPVLEKYGFPAIIFVNVGNIGKTGYLDYSQIKTMLKNGVSFGSHAIDHLYLPDLKKEDREYQIVQSKKILENNLKEKIDFIAYPIGGFTPEIQEITRAAGYKAACTTNRGLKNTYKNDDLYALKRIKITNEDKGFILWVKLSGYYNLLRKTKGAN